MEFTAQTKIDPIHNEFFSDTAEYVGRLRSKLLSDLLSSKDPLELKKKYISEYGLTARQFNSLICEVKGMIESAEELRKLNIENLTLQIKKLKKSIRSLEKKLKKVNPACGIKGKRSLRKSIEFTLHQKRRKLHSLENRLKELKGKDVSICLGGKELFLAQYNLEENGYNSYEEWLEDWRKRRSNRIFYIGSSDESFGNQNCQLIGGRLQIRVIPALESKYGKYYCIDGITFSYGEDVINKALIVGKAISFRFMRKEKGWYLHATTERESAEIISRKSLGAIGVDINPSHMEYAEINRHGNLVGSGRISVQIQDRSEEQVSADLGDTVKEVVGIAKEKGKPIVIEKLDFSKKKAELEGEGVRYRRMISYFAYSKFYWMLKSRAEKEGVEVIEVNPAYSSVMGRYKFALQYGISVHIAASLVLARRGLNFSERPPANNALCLAEHRHKHVWSLWRLFVKAVSNRELGVSLIRLRQSGTSPPWGGYVPG